MPFASIDDINVHLPSDKIEVGSDLYALVEQDGERVVRGYLTGYIDGTVIATWTTPDTTPELIRAITGRLCAFFRYAERYSEDSLDVPEYALFKYNEAIGWLQQIQAGTMSIPDVDSDSGLDLDADQFFPNDDTPGPYFTMDMNL